MKPSLLIICLFVCNFAFGQTKEETISLIKEILTKHSIPADAQNGEVKIITASPCAIDYEVKYQYKKDNFAYEIHTGYTFNTYSTVWDKTLCAEQNIIRETSIKFNKSMYRKCLPLIENGNKDIKKQLAKALNHLSTFCQRED